MEAYLRPDMVPSRSGHEQPPKSSGPMAIAEYYFLGTQTHLLTPLQLPPLSPLLPYFKPSLHLLYPLMSTLQPQSTDLVLPLMLPWTHLQVLQVIRQILPFYRLFPPPHRNPHPPLIFHTHLLPISNSSSS